MRPLQGLQLNNLLYFDTEAITWNELYDEAVIFMDKVVNLRSDRVAFLVNSAREAMSVVIYGLKNNLDWCVIEKGRVSGEIKEHLRRNGISLVDFKTSRFMGSSSKYNQTKEGRINVLTSGTTGLIKIIEHNVTTLNTFNRVSNIQTNTWFLPYQIGTYAWFQMVFLSLFVPKQALASADFSDLLGSFEKYLSINIITAVSSTPTFWRHALMNIDNKLLANADITNISLGGEIVDQAILDRLSVLHPKAIIRHIYASSEAGAAIVVSDGQAGFDASLLDNGDGVIKLKVIDKLLHIMSPYGNTAEHDRWINTGDIVEQRDNRVYICGRADNQLINVGGQKAFPSDIEAHLLTHPSVQWAKVFAKKAPLVGQLPVAKIVLNCQMDSKEAEIMLYKHCTNHLAEHAIPRIWEFFDTIPIKTSLKS
jgi:acyl-CoA synthetase (AMP-forming)/AMP-acid ligase II